jgi:hypothetical protein
MRSPCCLCILLCLAFCPSIPHNFVGFEDYEINSLYVGDFPINFRLEVYEVTLLSACIFSPSFFGYVFSEYFGFLSKFSFHQLLHVHYSYYCRRHTIAYLLRVSLNNKLGKTHKVYVRMGTTD